MSSTVSQGSAAAILSHVHLANSTIYSELNSVKTRLENTRDPSQSSEHESHTMKQHIMSRFPFVWYVSGARALLKYLELKLKVKAWAEALQDLLQCEILEWRERRERS